MDPLSIIGTVIPAIKYLVQIVETIADAPQALATIVLQANILQEELGRLKALHDNMSPDQQRFIKTKLVPYEEDFSSTKKDLDKLIQSIKKGEGSSLSLLGKAKWAWNEDKINKLADRFSKQADAVKGVFLVLIAEQTFKNGASSKQLNGAFSRLKGPSAAFDSNGIASAYSTDTLLWLGQWRCKPGQGRHMEYFKAREDLAAAIWSSSWDKMKLLLAYGREHYGQKWGATWRIVPSTDETGKPSSGYTALHQAAWHGASVQLIEELIEREGSRSEAASPKKTMGSKLTSVLGLARTLKDIHRTPLDIAKEKGWAHLYPILRPVSRRPVSPKVLLKLQDRLHVLIWESFIKDSDIHLECFIFPELEILTEYDHSHLWFPLSPESADTHSGPGVNVALDTVELVATLHFGSGKKKIYRISASGTRQVERAIVLA